MAALKSVWLVIDPSPVNLTESEEVQLGDCCWEQAVNRLGDYVVGSGPGKWLKEHTEMYLTEAEAKKDAQGRLKKLWASKKAAVVAFDTVLKA